MHLKKIQDLHLDNKKILLRADFNAPIGADGSVADETRIRATIPTIEILIEHNCKILIISHFGQPRIGYETKFSLQQILPTLERLLWKKVGFLTHAPEKVDILENIFDTYDIILAENLRFYEGEKKNDATYLQDAVGWADIYVNDAFGVCHRAHASVSAVVDIFNSLDKPTVSGLLLQKEYEYLHEEIRNPEGPFVALLGGSKVSSKLWAIEILLVKADTIILGGAMVFTFMKAVEKEIGKSLYEPELVVTAKSILEKANMLWKKIILPLDYMVASEFSEHSTTSVVDAEDIPPDMMALDIWPRSIEQIQEVCQSAKTIFWNWPMWAYEMSSFSSGSIGVARVLADASALTFAGGGDSLAIIQSSGYSDGFDFLSTGGGASLELIEWKALPGIEKLLV